MRDLGWCSACVISVWVSVPVIAAPAPKKVVAKGYATPEACFRAVQTAVTKSDWKGWYHCMTDKAREAMTGRLVLLGAACADHGPGLNKEAEAVHRVMTRHGVSNEMMAKARKENPGPGDSRGPKKHHEVARRWAKVIKDRPKFIAELFAAMKEAGLTVEETENGELKDVKVTGNRAEGTYENVRGPFKGNKTLMVFHKDRGGWRMSLPGLEEK